MRNLTRILLVLVTVLFLVISGTLVFETDGRLFLTDQAYPARDAANAIAAGKLVPQEGLVALFHASANQLLAERQRIKSLGELTKELGWVLMALSVFQGMLIFHIVRK